jgi:glycosyltransferase involved in cell wall biosynthesis
MKVKYIGPAKDYSGYGEANRHDIASLMEAGVETTAEIPRYTQEPADFGRIGQLVESIEGRPLDYKAIIIHTTPNVYKQHLEPGIYSIGRVFWETDKLPPDFAQPLQYVDEIWTGSVFNKEAIENAGVINKPIHIIPEAIDTEIDVESFKPYKTPNEKDYKFYSIFEWTERKNPKALLEAFWREFENTEGVSLTLKTYVDNFRPVKQQEIHKDINILKAKLGLKRYAPVYLYKNLMDRHQIYRFHATFNCFVSAHRGEGWGIPQMEALLMGKPVISTNLGGIHEYLTHKRSAYLCDFNLVPLSGNTRNQQWYRQDQKWGEVNLEQLRENMRYVFENQAKAKEVGLKGQDLVKRSFSLKTVGNLMKNRLNQISEGKI